MPKIIKKCLQCSGEYEAYPYMASKPNNFFCSMSCATQYRIDKIKFTQDDIDYVAANILTVKLSDMAIHLNSTVKSLERYISNWRTAGHAIPKRRNRKIQVPKKKRIKAVKIPNTPKKQSALPLPKPEPVLKTPKPLTGGRWERINSRTLKYVYDRQ